MLPLLFFADTRLMFAVYLTYNACLVVLFVVDWRVSHDKTNLIVTRGDAVLRYKMQNAVTINIKNNHRGSLHAEARDEPPACFEVTDASPRLIMPGETAEFVYDATPDKRGVFAFGNVHVKTTGRLGLCHKYFIYNTPAEAKVFPDVTDAGKYRLALHKNRLLFQGERRLPLTGAGTEFESLRAYVSGDDYRKINWPATAREGKPVINLYETERNQPVYIMVDTGRAMGYSVRGYKKLDYAINAALILSDIVNKKGDNSGLIVFGATVGCVVPPGKGPDHRNAVMEALYRAESTRETPNYKLAFGEVAARHKRGGIVIIFTDFETDFEADDVLSALPILKKRHTPAIALMENESAAQLAKAAPDDVRGIYRGSFAADYLIKRDAMIKKINARVLCFQTNAEKFSLESVNRYLELRSLRGV